MVLKFGVFGLAIYGLIVSTSFGKYWSGGGSFPPTDQTYLDMGIVSFGAGHGYMLGYNTVAVMWFFLPSRYVQLKLVAIPITSYLGLPLASEDCGGFVGSRAWSDMRL